MKQLEAALRAKVQLVGEESHPLLDGPTTHDTFEDGIDDLTDAIGTISITNDGRAIYHGETVSSEVSNQSLTISKLFTILHTVSARAGET